MVVAIQPSSRLPNTQHASTPALLAGSVSICPNAAKCHLQIPFTTLPTCTAKTTCSDQVKTPAISWNIRRVIDVLSIDGLYMRHEQKNRFDAGNPGHADSKDAYAGAVARIRYSVIDKVRFG